jgi:hypothetical protein
MHAKALIVVSSLLLWPSVSAAQQQGVADKKVALVIGNSAYEHVTKLPNPANDAAAIASTLRNAGFTVTESRRDLSLNEFRRVIRQFGEVVRDADIAVVFYAGHGIEVDGVNYLVPADARLASDLDVEDEAVSLDRIIRALEPARRLRLVILDACRDNPFLKDMKRTSATRSVGRGLAKIEPATPDTLIAFAAKAGSTAVDGDGSHSPYTESLLKHLATPDLDVRLALGRVRDEVLAKTRRQQEPFIYGSLGGAAITLATSPPKAASAPMPPVAPTEQASRAQRDYEYSERLGTKEGWDLFLTQHPGGYLAELARAHRAKLVRPATSEAALAPLPPSVPPSTVPALAAPAPAACGFGSKMRNGRCVKVACSAGQVRGRDGSCTNRKERAAAITPETGAPENSRGRSTSQSTGSRVRCGRFGCSTLNLAKREPCRQLARERRVGEPYSPERKAFVRSCMAQ